MSYKENLISYQHWSVKFRVRMGPLHVLAWRKRRMNGAVLRMRPQKTETLCYSRCVTIKIPPYSEALSAKLRLKVCRVKDSWVGKIFQSTIKLGDWGGPSDDTGKTEVPCHSRCDTIKIPPCSKALSAEQRPKFAALHEKFLSGT
jgi:hypothetical protein